MTDPKPSPEEVINGHIKWMSGNTDLVLVPDGWPCTLEECRPGAFVATTRCDLLCFKSEYHTDDGRPMAYNSAGEFWHSDEMVQPVTLEEVER